MKKTLRQIRRPFPVTVEPLENRCLLSATLTATPSAAFGKYHSSFVPLGSALYFLSSDGVHGDQLYKSDGTAAGTTLVKDINPNVGSTYVSQASLTALGNKLLFFENDGVNGIQLWQTDGTAAGTNAIANSPSTSPMAVWKGDVYFAEAQGTDYSLWKTDGSSAGTSQVSSLPANPTEIVPVGNLLYLHAYTFVSSVRMDALYTSDGTAGGVTTAIAFSTSGIADLTACGNVAYFYSGTEYTVEHLERYDPVNGEVLIANTYNYILGIPNFAPEIAYLHDAVYFVGQDLGDTLHPQYSRIFQTDGTVAGTHLLENSVLPHQAFGLSGLTVADDILYYFGEDSRDPTPGQSYLWSTDGVRINRLAVADPGPTVVFHNQLLFLAANGQGGDDLWISDNTLAGSRDLGTLFNTAPLDISSMEPIGNNLVLSVDANYSNRLLYFTDLTAPADQPLTGALGPVHTQTVTGTVHQTNAADSVDIRVVIDGWTQTTFAAGSADTGDNREFTWYIPVLPPGNHTVTFYAIDGWTGAAVKIDSRVIAGSNSMFDERYYLTTYPDVAAAVNAGQFASGYAHFVAYGQYENRQPSPFFDPKFYLATNPGVAAAVAAGQIASAWQHFVQYGQFENRDPSPFFNTAFYLSSNPSVAAAVADHSMSAFQHFLYYGQFEQRDTTPWFNQASYLAQNPDVQSAVADGQLSSALAHFISNGQQENRPYVAAMTFDETAYLARYPDVAAAVAAGQFTSGLEHFLWYGLSEGRSPS